MCFRVGLRAMAALLLVFTSCNVSDVEVSSPDKNLEICLLTSGGKAEIAVDFKGKQVIEPSKIGFVFNDVEWGNGVRIIEKRKETVTEDFDMPIGKVSHVHSESNQLSVLLVDSTGRKVWVILRAFDDGVAYRYVFPEQEAMDSLLIENEVLEICTAGNPAVKALHVKGYNNTHEGRYTHSSVDSLEVGRLRCRADGSAGGHNGIKSIIQEVGSQAFPRVKIGVGSKPHKDADLADWVLSGFAPAEQQALDFALDNAANAAICILEKGIYEAANRFNGTHP